MGSNGTGGEAHTIAAFDFGTSSVKLSVTTAAGGLLASAKADYPTHTAPGGIAEQDADSWWAAAATALAETGVAERVTAIGLTGQMQDLILVTDADADADADAGAETCTGARALRPVLLYSDTRATQQHRRLLREIPNWQQATGNVQDASNVAAKIAWLAEHEPAQIDAADRLLFGAAGFIGWRATGVAVCDVLTASTTGLLHVQHREWFTELVTVAGASAAQLPKLIGVHEGDSLIGAVHSEAAAALGVREGIPVVHAIGDAGTATDGLVGSAPGDAYLSLGTTGWFAAVTASTAHTAGNANTASTEPAALAGQASQEPVNEEFSPIHSLVMPGWNNRLRIGAVQSAGSAAAWAKHTFLPELTFAEIEASAFDRLSEPAIVAALPLALPSLTGERTPVRDEAFRAAFIGVSDATQPIDFYIATLTGVAYALRHVADELGVQQPRIPLVGGGARSPLWQQILADVFNATIVTSQVETDGVGTGSGGTGHGADTAGGADATGAADMNEPGARSVLRAVVAQLGLPEQVDPLFQQGEAQHVETLTGPRFTEVTPSAAQPIYAARIAVHRGLYEALAPTFHQLAAR